MAGADNYEVLQLTDEEYAEVGIKPTEIRLIVLAEGDYCVHVPALGEYGFGDTISAALKDLAGGIKWFYAFLTTREPDLTDGLADDLKRFRALVAE